ncbi:type VI secretion protein VgrG, partial [Helicobacter valdiviensis]
MQEDLFNSLQTNFYPHSSNNTNNKTNSSLNSNSKDLNFHPKVLIDRFATFIINNPYPSKTIEFNKQDNNSTPSNNTKTYQGIISYVKYLGINEIAPLNINSINSKTKTLNYKHFFSFKIQSPLIRLSFNKANRIYTHINIIEAIKQTLNFYQGRLGKEIDFSNIYYNYEDKELISQYQESDLDFIKRISHNHGIFFYEDASKIYFCDHYIKNIPKSLKYNPNPNNILNEPCISSFYKEESIYPNVFIHSSIQSHTPLNLLSLQSSKAPYEIHLNNKATYYEHTYESEYSFSQSIDLKTSPSLKERRIITLQESIQANSNIYHLSLGEFIKLEDSTFTNSKEEDKDKNTFLKDFVIIANTQTLIDDAILTHSINTNDNTPLKDLKLNRSYSNTLSILPSHLIFTPSFKEKPKAPLNTQGIVIGESKEIQSERNTIYTDQYGRVKVRINLYANQEEIDNNFLNSNNNILDTNNNNNNNINTKENKVSSKDTSLINSSLSNLSSNTYKSYHHTPFLRVATNIASNHSGFYHTPRVGDEVIVSFLDDDIDKPYVSSSLYNRTNPSLVNLPFNDHQTSLSSKTIGVNEEGYNELTMSNIKNKEQIYLKAEKDYDELIQHNFSQKILNDKDVIVDGLYNERIKKVHTQTIDLAKNVNVGAEYLTNVGLSKDTIVGLSNTLNVGVDNKVRVAKNSSEYVGE